MNFFCPFGQILFNLAQTFATHHEKSFVPVFFFFFFNSLFITHLITLSLEKEIIVLEKILQKILNFGPKNLCERCI